MQSMDTPDGATRPLVRETTLEEYKKEPDFAKEEETPYDLTLYPPYPYKEEKYSWGMAIGPEQQSFEVESAVTKLQPPGRIKHPPKNNVPCRSKKSEPGDERDEHVATAASAVRPTRSAAERTALGQAK